MEALYIYFRAERVEEPYVSITKKRQMPKDGYSEEIEKEVGQAEGKLRTHRSAFSRASVIQAFLGSAPQLTLQLYICILQQEVTVARSRWSCCYDLFGIWVGGQSVIAALHKSQALGNGFHLPDSFCFQVDVAFNFISSCFRL